jgi:tetratricopeptide (TPR) repeat protein
MDIAKNRETEEHDSTQRYEVLKELGDCYVSTGDFLQAQKCYEKAATLSPDDAAPYVGLGVIALQQNLPDDAEVAFKVACRLDGKCSKAYTGMAMVAQQKGNDKQAFEMYLKGLELDSDSLTALLGLFQTSCKMGTFAQVIHYLEVYLDMHPGDCSVMFTLAALYIRENKIDRSRQILLDILALDEQNQDARKLLEEIEHNELQSR